MPFKSKAQAGYLFAKKPKVAKEFADATKEEGINIKKLPEHVKQKKAQPSGITQLRKKMLLRG